MDDGDDQVLKGILLAFCIMMLVSHLSWYIGTALVCPAQYPVPFRCFIGSIVSAGFLILYIPAGIFWWIVSFLFGGANHGLLTFLFAAATAALLAMGKGSKLMDVLVNIASFLFVSASKIERDPTSPRPESTSRKKTMEEENKRDKSRASMEEAMREMEKAKASLDEFKKRN